LAIFGGPGDVAHFFWRAIWTNEIRRILKSDAGLAIAFMAKTPENTEIEMARNDFRLILKRFDANSELTRIFQNF